MQKLSKQRYNRKQGIIVKATAHALITALLMTAGLSAQATDAKQQHFSYKDVFELEYAAAPLFTPDSKHVIYERRSNDIMNDRMHASLWRYDIKRDQHRPLIAEHANVRAAVLSPDGNKLAYLSDRSGSQQLYIRYLDTNDEALLTHGEFSPHSVVWAPNSQQLAFKLFTPKKSPPLFSAMPTKPKKATWAKTGTFIDSVNYRADGAGYVPSGFSQVYVLPVEGGTPKQLTFGDYPVNGPIAWNTSGNGLIISINPSKNYALEVLSTDLYALDITSKSLTQLTSMDGPESAPKLSADGEYIAFRHTTDLKMSYQLSDLWVLEVESGESINLTQGFDRSVGQFEWASDSEELYFSYEDHGTTRVSRVTLNGKLAALDISLGGQSLGRPYTSGSFALAPNDSLVYTAANSIRPADLTLRSERGKSQVITQLNEDVLAHLTLPEAQEIKLASTVDQRDIYAWMLTPPDFDSSKAYPLILEIHGGPHAAYGPQFSAELQLMAAQGYVVVWSNPRGSTSYGAEFANLIHHNYPSQDFDDLMDVVDAVIAKGFIDSKSLFITGGSGGGVLTAWSIGKTNRFAAAVVAKPVINWMSFALTADAYSYFTQYWMPDMPWNIPEHLWAHSPLSLVGNVTTPTLLLTGEADYRTPISESEQYYQALKLQGVDAAMLRLPGASHGIAAKPSRLVQKVGNIIAWFERYRESEETQ